jgi:kynureninase
MDDPLERHRDQFPILAESTYLVSHSLGAMPASTFDAMQAFTQQWATRGVQSWADGWWQMPLTVGDELAPIIGAAPGTIAMHQNVSVCQSLILSCFEPTPARNRIVLPELEFPSVLYVYEQHARNGDLEVARVPSADGMTIDTQAMVDAIDERTLLVPISHVLFASGYLMDVEPIVARAHEVGALVVLDTYQSAGTVPFDVTALDVDFATGGSVKWLCGGPGAGYLYVNPRHHGLEPKVTGWMAHAAPFAFEPEQRYAEGIARFLHGSPAVPSLYAAREGYRAIREVGMDAIRAKSQRLTQRFIELVDEAADAGADLRVTSPRVPARRGGTVTVDAASGAGASVAAELIRRGIIVDFRPGAGVRVSPHFYTLESEVEAAVAALAEAAGDARVTGESSVTAF